MKRQIATIGWREWVSLPDLSVPWVKAKIDTGARSSSLHAFDLEHFERGEAPWVRFVVHPWQRSSADPIVVEAPLADARSVRSSSGKRQHRPVIRTRIDFGGAPRLADITLTRRDEMGFRMLVGREAIRGDYLVDAGRSYRLGLPPKTIRADNRKADDLQADDSQVDDSEEEA